jgi:hypothetical protein
MDPDSALRRKRQEIQGVVQCAEEAFSSTYFRSKSDRMIVSVTVVEFVVGGAVEGAVAVLLGGERRGVIRLGRGPRRGLVLAKDSGWRAGASVPGTRRTRKERIGKNKAARA